MSDTRVYIADLAAYNEGNLVGEWFDPTEYAEAEDFETAVSEWLAGLPHPDYTGPREEFAIHDFEGFGDQEIGEYESLAAVHELAEGIEQHGLAYAAYLSNGYAPANFEDAYQGEFRDEEEFAQDYAEQLGLIPAESSWPASCIDWAQATRELFMDFWSAKADGGNVYVFRAV